MGVGRDYDEGSSNQGSANKGALKWLKQGAVAALKITPGVINMLDLGSASGKNSAVELRDAVEALRQSEGTTKRDIVITHVDTLDNDWIQLAHTIAASPNSYTAASDRVYGHFQAKSFFEQVAPDQTVALAYSGISFHWISKVHRLSDFWAQNPETADQEHYSANKQQAAQDWMQLLRMRAAELLPGGHLIATAGTLKGSESFNFFAGFINQAWSELLAKGIINEQECQSFAGQHWFRSKEEWLDPLDGDLKDTFDLLHFEEGAATDPHWVEYQHSRETSSNQHQPKGIQQNGQQIGDERGNSQQDRGQGQQGNGSQEMSARQLADGYSKFFFGVIPGQIKAQLKRRSNADLDKILAGMRERFIELASEHPAELKLSFALIVLRRK